MTPHQFIAKWKPADLKERAACQEHLLDICAVLGEPTPAVARVPCLLMPSSEQF